MKHALPRRTALSTGALLLLNGCTTHPVWPPDQVLIASGLTVRMPDPASLNRRIEAAQLVVARYRTQTIAFEARISAAPDHFNLLCIDTLGREAVRIHWTQAAIVSEKAPWVPKNLRPENMLADIVILYWPEAVVAQALAPSGGTILAELGFRSIRLAGKELIHAQFHPTDTDPWNGKARYHNLSRDYTLDIQSRLIQP
ncbi:MAG TPA: DUF3261 domain-containing protein [Rhodopila sp.]|jgi:hypothetical protein|nr:DUF3261 domain-containing protein [Rhodopila sp.]